MFAAVPRMNRVDTREKATVGVCPKRKARSTAKALALGRPPAHLTVCVFLLHWTRVSVCRHLSQGAVQVLQY
jgi:hypothetical protein